MKIKLSDFLSLNLTDLVKGLVMTVLGAVAATVYELVQNGAFDWNTVWKVALSTGLSYLIKNFFTPQPDTVVIDPTKTDIEHKKMKKEAISLLAFYVLAIVVILWLISCNTVKQVLKSKEKTNKVVWSWMQDNPFRNDTTFIKVKTVYE